MSTMRELMTDDLTVNELGSPGCFCSSSGCYAAMMRYCSMQVNRPSKDPLREDIQRARKFLHDMSDTAFLAFYRKAVRASALKNVADIQIDPSFWTCFAV